MASRAKQPKDSEAKRTRTKSLASMLVLAKVVLVRLASLSFGCSTLLAMTNVFKQHYHSPGVYFAG